MDRYIGIDSGKLDTKSAVYQENKQVMRHKFRTRIGEGDFADDEMETGAFIAEVDGKVYKVGNGARMPANLETSKMTEVHRICSLVAIAMCCDENTVDNVHVAIGIPVSEFSVVSKRNEYREFILPTGEVSVTLKTGNNKQPKKIRFNIVEKIVCPESSGILYLDPARHVDKESAILDIGNLNVNGTYWNGFDINPDYCLTAELGGNILISNLAQELTARFGSCNESIVASVLKKPLEERCLIPVREDVREQVMKESREVIDQMLREHVETIKRKCNTKHWSLNFMDIVFVGGTTQLLRKEINDVFGDSVTIAEDPVFANAVGFLTKLCSRSLGVFLPDKCKENEKSNGSKKELKKAS